MTPSIVSVYYNSKVIIKFRQWKNVLKLIWEDIVTISANKGLKQARIGKKIQNLTWKCHRTVMTFKFHTLINLDSISEIEKIKCWL